MRADIGLLLVVMVLTGACGFVAGYDFRKSKSANLSPQIDSIVVERVKLDTLYKTDTIRLWRAMTKYDTVRTTDTVMRGDTVYVRRDVADEAINACSNAIIRCQQRAELAARQVELLTDSLDRVPPPVDKRKVVAMTASITTAIVAVIAMFAR